MRPYGLLFSAGVAAALAFPAVAQQQAIRPPIAIYWMNAATGSGMGGAGISTADVMRMALGGGAGAAVRTLSLQLGSSQAASGAPRAAHDIPPALNMGPSLPLVSPLQAKPEPRERDLPEGVEQPKGRMLIFWGCGEKAGPGQPVIIDFAKLGPDQRAPGIVSRHVARAQGPAPGRNRSYGDWPNTEDSKPVPVDASLRGDHRVAGNYSPEIRFSITDRHDFMPAVRLSAARSGDAMRISWAEVERSTGSFMMAIGGGSANNEVVMWSSSEVQEMGGSLMDYIAPAEVVRLVKERVVLAPERNDCTVSGEAMKALGTPVLQFIAYGDELNLVQPPRPQDPKVPWEQQWAMKLRLKSTAMLPLMEGMPGSGIERRESRREGPVPGQNAPPAAPSSQPAQPAQPARPVEQGVQEGIRVLRGIFGR